MEHLTGVIYDKIDDDGLHVWVNGESRVIEVDTIILCAGQEAERSLYKELQALGVDAKMIGGAKEAIELDALRAIEEGVRLAQSF